MIVKEMPVSNTGGAKKSKRGDARRDALIQAAAMLFWRQGYHCASLADVAKVADVPIGNLYYYYKTKSDLAFAVAKLFVEQTENLVDAVSEDEQQPRKRLKLLVKRMRQTQGERLVYGCPIAAACRDFRHNAPEASQMAATSFSILTGFMARELGAVGHRPSVAMAKARQAMADWQGSIALAHGLEQANILAEAYGRMERTLLT